VIPACCSVCGSLVIPGSHRPVPREAAGGAAGLRKDDAVAEVVVVRAADLDGDTPQTAGLRRLEAISGRLAGSAGIWMGLSVLAPGARTAVHHHGDSETALYVLRGTGRWWIGHNRATVCEAHAGDFVFVPPNAVHWEENASADEPVEMIVARSTQEAIVVNLGEPS
jgi:uncharacterized RmlC-like cupin family protein